MSRYKPKGWRNESVRHGLSAKGIKTKVNIIPYKIKKESKSDKYIRQLKEEIPFQRIMRDGREKDKVMEVRRKYIKEYNDFNAKLYNVDNLKDIKNLKWNTPKKQVEENNKKIDRFIDYLNLHSWIPIRDKDTATRLIGERLAETSKINDEVWNNLSTQIFSTKHFDKPRTDPSLPVLMVDVEFLSRRKGNPLRKDIEKLKDVIRRGEKIFDIPIYDVKTHKVEEGNHRVEAFRQLGIKSIPVDVQGAWD